MDVLEAVRAKALLAVLKPDGEYHARYVRRWYSRTFHTPLHVVEELPMLDILEHYYECEFEELEPDKRKEAIAYLLETPEQRKARVLDQDAEDAAAEELMKVAAEENRKFEATTEPTMITAPVMREPDLPIQTTVPPDIKMVFIEPESLEEEGNGFGSLAPPPKRR